MCVQEAPPSSYSEIIRLSPLFLPRNGRITRLSTRVQFFYNEHGRVRIAAISTPELRSKAIG
jgi:hypothetical protein